MNNTIDMRDMAHEMPITAEQLRDALPLLTDTYVRATSHNTTTARRYSPYSNARALLRSFERAAAALGYKVERVQK